MLLRIFKDTLAFNQKVVAQNLQLQALPSSSNGVHSKRINHRAQTYTKQTNKHTKNKAPNKRKALKTTLKDRLD
jgi:hypothetical protein